MKSLYANRRLWRNSLRYDWWKVVLAALVVSLAGGYAFYQKDRLKDDEVLEVFITGEAKDRAFGDALYRSVAAVSSIQEVSTLSYPLDTANYETILQGRFYSSSDLVFLPSSVLNSKSEYAAGAEKFSEGQIADVASISSSFSFYQDERGTLGVKIYDGEDASYNDKFAFSAELSFTETTFLFIVSSSGNEDDETNDGTPLLFYAFEEILKRGLK